MMFKSGFAAMLQRFFITLTDRPSVYKMIIK